MLRGLLIEHNVRQVWVEGLTPKSLPNFIALVDLVKTDQDEHSALGAQERQAAELLNGLETAGSGEAAGVSKALRDQLTGLQAERRFRRLRIGAAGQLLISGEVDELVPLDDDHAHAAANPHFSGTVTIDPVAINAREAAMVTRLLAADEPVSIIVLGVGHDSGGQPVESELSAGDAATGKAVDRLMSCRADGPRAIRGV